MNKSADLQRELGHYCRTGKDEPQTSIQENTYQYRRLVYNIIEGTILRAFPMTKKLVGEDRMKASIDNFYSKHKCRSTEVWKLPFEYYEYYKENDFPEDANYPFLRELLYYEWLEIEIFMMEDMPVPEYHEEGDWERDILVPNPEVKILPLEFPIHKKTLNEITEQDRGQYYATIHRNTEDKKIYINDLSYPFVEMLLKIHEDSSTFADILDISLKYESDKEKATEHVQTFIDFGFKNNLLLGYN